MSDGGDGIGAALLEDIDYFLPPATTTTTEAVDGKKAAHVSAKAQDVTWVVSAEDDDDDTAVVPVASPTPSFTTAAAAATTTTMSSPEQTTDAPPQSIRKKLDDFTLNISPTLLRESTVCTDCGLEVALVVINEDPQRLLQLQRRTLVRCIDCRPEQSVSKFVAAESTSVAPLLRQNKRRAPNESVMTREDSRVFCDICSRRIGTGGILPVEKHGEAKDGKSNEPLNLRVEVYCYQCIKEFDYCAMCQDANFIGLPSAAWRPREMFESKPDGTVSAHCNMSHQTLGRLESTSIGFVTYECPPMRPMMTSEWRPNPSHAGKRFDLFPEVRDDGAATMTALCEKVLEMKAEELNHISTTPWILRLASMIVPQGVWEYFTSNKSTVLRRYELFMLGGPTPTGPMRLGLDVRKYITVGVTDKRTRVRKKGAEKVATDGTPRVIASHMVMWNVTDRHVWKFNMGVVTGYNEGLFSGLQMSPFRRIEQEYVDGGLPEPLYIWFIFQEAMVGEKVAWGPFRRIDKFSADAGVPEEELWGMLARMNSGMQHAKGNGFWYGVVRWSERERFAKEREI